MPSDMEDIELARSLLEEEQWNLVIVKGSRVLFNSKERGVASLFQAIQSIRQGLHNAAVADRIVGSAAAMLCLYARISSVYAGIASQGALDILTGQGVTISSKNIVPYIANYDGTDLCPFEKMAKDAGEPSRLLATLQSLFAEGDE
jgi:hypothetical protein